MIVDTEGEYVELGMQQSGETSMRRRRRAKALDISCDAGRPVWEDDLPGQATEP